MNREPLIDRWLESVLSSKAFERKAMVGDASQRTYYRILQGDQSYVLMDAPPPENPRRFVDCQVILAGAGLKVPQIVAVDFHQGLLLLSDLGDNLYLQHLNDQSADRLYDHALAALIPLHQCRAPLAHFNRAFMHRQLVDLFEHWYLKRHIDRSLSWDDKRALAGVYRLIFENARAQPQVLIHRDYHSRNLMVLPDQGPGILDFQDAMRGPLTYDLVSLLQDCYISWPADRIHIWVQSFQDRAVQAGLLGRVSDAQFLRWFHFTGLQRHLKNIGIFARLCYRDHKTAYIKAIPRVLAYIDDMCTLYPELQPLSVLL